MLNRSPLQDAPFPTGGGQTGEQIRSMDWRSHPLGSVENWPQSLRTTLDLILAVKFPMFLFWGTDLYCFYNDAYRPNLAKYSTQQEVIGQRGESVWAENWPRLKPLIDHIFANGESIVVEDKSFPTVSAGPALPTYWTYCLSAVTDEAGRPAGVLITALETTPKVLAHQRVEDKMRKSQALLSRTEALAHIGSYEQVFATGELTVSDEMYRIYGYEPHPEPMPPDWPQTIIDEINARTHPDDVLNINALIRQAETDGLAFSSTRRLYLPDGQLRYLFSQHEVVCDERGKPLKMNGLTQDITAQTLAQQQLQQTAQYLQMVLDSSPAAIAFFRPLRDDQQKVVDFQIAVCNQKIASITGRTIEQLAGLSASSLSNPFWPQQLVESLHQTLETGDPVYQELFIEPAGVWSLITLTRYGDGVVLNGQDVTALKKAEQQQEHWLNQLERSEESLQILAQLRQELRQRGELLRSSTHDLKASFGIIYGSASLLEVVRSEEEREQVQTMLQKNLDRATELIMQLLDYSRLEAGQEQVQLAPFDAALFLQELCSSVRPLATQKGLWLRTQGGPSLRVVSDQINVQRIVQNLLLNAIRYTKAGGITLSWGTGEANGFWSLVVEDTGSGLLPTQVSALMDQSLETDAPTMRSSGEGIGLIIVKWLVKLLGGQLRVESQLQAGARFVIQLPGLLVE